MAKLLPRYVWLESIQVLPRTIQEGLKLYGTQEAPGAADNPVIMGWIKELKAAGVSLVGYNADAIPWCGLFAGVVVRRAGKQPVPAPLWALNWRNFGISIKTPGLGDVLVFRREAGGHVGFYIAEDRDCYHVLGGNQADGVNILRIERSRCVAARSPAYSVRPGSAVPIRMKADGVVSFNEA